MIVGAVFVVFQLRQNAKQIKQHEKTLEAMSAANRSHNAFELIGKVIDPSFPVRRHRLYEVSEKYSGGDWIGFDRSLDDFEVRNFANIYEQVGLLVKKGVIDLQDVMDALSAQPMAIELAALGVALDLLVETRGLEFLEPRPKARELVGRELGDGLFDVFKLGHARQDSTAALSEANWGLANVYARA